MKFESLFLASLASAYAVNHLMAKSANTLEKRVQGNIGGGNNDLDSRKLEVNAADCGPDAETGGETGQVPGGETGQEDPTGETGQEDPTGETGQDDTSGNTGEEETADTENQDSGNSDAVAPKKKGKKKDKKDRANNLKGKRRRLRLANRRN